MKTNLCLLALVITSTSAFCCPVNAEVKVNGLVIETDTPPLAIRVDAPPADVENPSPVTVTVTSVPVALYNKLGIDTPPAVLCLQGISVPQDMEAFRVGDGTPNPLCCAAAPLKSISNTINVSKISFKQGETVLLEVAGASPMVSAVFSQQKRDFGCKVAF